MLMTLQEILNSNFAYWGLIGASVIIGAIGILKFYFRYQRDSKRKAYAKDVVVLHQFPLKKGKTSLSPFCFKLESWLKVTNVKYQNEFSWFDRSPKGKLPYITYNGSDVSDSNLAIVYLTKELGKDLDKNLSVEEKAYSRAFSTLCEESLRWCVIIQRFKTDNAALLELPSLMFKIIKRSVDKYTKAQGYGLHTREEINEIGNADLKALEDFLGEKKFFFGNEITSLDIMVFTYITSIAFYDRGQLNDYVKANCPNLVRHFKAMKETYWPELNDDFICI